MRLVALVRGVGDAGAIRRPAAEIVDHRRIGGQLARLGRRVARIEQQQLLALVAAAVDAIDQPVIHRRTAQQRDLLVVEGELPVGAGREIQRPDLRQARTAQVEQRLSVTGERRRGGGADRDEGFRIVRHAGSIPCRAGVGKPDRIGFARRMRRVVLANETDWEGWRKATRSLVLAGVAPEDVRWSVRSHDEDGDPLPEGPAASACRARWSRWRRWRSRRAMRRASTCCIGWSGAPTPERRPMTRRRCGGRSASPSRCAPRRTDAHACCAILPVPEGNRTRYLGWYEPAHYVLEANAQLIARQFPDLAFSILTPDGGAHWDGTELRFSAAWRAGRAGRRGVAIVVARAPRTPAATCAHRHGHPRGGTAR